MKLDELFYRLLLARIKDVTGRNPLNVLRENLVGALDDHGESIQNAIQQLVSLPNMNVAGVEAGDESRMFQNIVVYKLLPRDALHLAIMQRLGISAIASDDADFDRVNECKRLWVINPA